MWWRTSHLVWGDNQHCLPDLAKCPMGQGEQLPKLVPTSVPQTTQCSDARQPSGVPRLTQKEAILPARVSGGSSQLAPFVTAMRSSWSPYSQRFFPSWGVGVRADLLVRWRWTGGGLEVRGAQGVRHDLAWDKSNRKVGERMAPTDWQNQGLGELSAMIKTIWSSKAVCTGWVNSRSQRSKQGTTFNIQ